MLTTALSAIGHDWTVRSRRPHAREVLRLLQEQEPDLAATGASSLPELLRHVTDPPPGAPVPHWRVTAALLRCWPVDELVTLGLLAVLQPGLIAVARQLEWGRGGPWPSADSFAVDLVSTAFDVLASVGGTTVPFPERTVLRRVRQRLTSQRRARRRRLQHEHLFADVELDAWSRDDDAGGSPHQVPSDSADDPRLTTLTVLDALALALRDVPSSELSPADVAIVYSHRVLGLSLREIAAASKQATTTVRLRCRRAEELLGATS